MPGTARIIDGKALAERLRASLKDQAAELARTVGVSPHLAVVLASEDPASAIYVRNKGRAADQAGIRSTQHVLSPNASTQELLERIALLNADPDIDGILVQLPLPPQHSSRAAIEAISPEKDVDGFHPVSAGRLARGDESGLLPCTPLGCIRLIESAGATIRGARAVVLGRSAIVGRPVAEMLLNRDATVTVCHSKTAELARVVGTADILVAAIGKPELVRGGWIKPGATVIDVGINRLASGKLVGDVFFPAALERAGAITPVPGGVGPMTIACLLENTVRAARRRRIANDGGGIR